MASLAAVLLPLLLEALVEVAELEEGSERKDDDDEEGASDEEEEVEVVASAGAAGSADDAASAFADAEAPADEGRTPS